MERLKERLSVAERALATLVDQLPRIEESTAARDAAILRFIYTFEATWMLARAYLAWQGTELTFPREVIRVCREGALLDTDDASAALAMVGDRNLAVHTYAEALATELAARLPGHAAVFGRWLSKLRAALY